MQRIKTLTSSTKNDKRPDAYAVTCRLVYRAPAPVLQDALEQNSLFGGIGGFTLGGTLGPEQLDSRKWVDPPHKVLANLPAQPFIEMKAAEAFTRKYGVLGFEMDEGKVLGFAPNEAQPAEDAKRRRASGMSFAVRSLEMQWAQHTLRQAWDGEPAAVERVRRDAVADMELLPLDGFGHRRQAGTFQLRANNLWSFICVLFLHDLALGRLGKCANPGCPAKYFVKRRRTQKFCEQGGCTSYAQRKYALKWWQHVGQKKRRTEESTRRSHSKEKKRE